MMRRILTVEKSIIKTNGLAVFDLGTYAFGQPSRITASASPGRAGLINIERESGLSGRLHDKGVLIIAGLLRERYARDFPLSLSAGIAFEQSYSGVDGDSASSTEVYALLSALSGVPIRQSIAVTGSVDQKGNVQAIGGVNEKIEGFFTVCSVKGPSADQGVLIPRSNVGDLMLREEIVEAVAEGRFHIWAVDTIDEGIEVLTGVPSEAIHERTAKRLREFAETLARFERGS
jgi:predicted ATP-dependent protease